MRTAWRWAVLGAAAVGCAGPETGENVAGLYEQTLVVGGQARTLLAYVPEAAEGASAPAVLVLHGTSGDGQRFYEVSGWREKADEQGIVVLFPDALLHCFYEDENHDGDFEDAGEQKVTTKWASGQLGVADAMPSCSAETIAALGPTQREAADHPVADDLGFFDAMLDLLATDYDVDDRAVYISGFSNGAQMAARLVVERSDVLAAGHAAAGTLAIDGEASSPIPMVFSVGTLDDRFTVPMGVSELPLDEAGLLGLPLFQYMVGNYLDALLLEPDYTYDRVSVGSEQVARLTFTSSSIGATNLLEVAVIEDLPHQYPNGQNHPLSAANTLWTFFEPLRLP